MNNPNARKTIKITKNNPESSRSILFIDFKVKVKDKFVPMTLVDMPGRENLLQSYRHSFKPRTSSRFFGATDQEMDNLLQVILWNPIYIIQLPEVRKKLYDILANQFDKDTFNKFAKKYFILLDSLKDDIKQSLSNQGNDYTDVCLYCFGIETTSSLQFDTGSDININSYGMFSSTNIIGDIKNKLTSASFKEATINNIQDNLRKLASNSNNWGNNDKKLSNIPYGTLNRDLKNAITCSICLIIFVAILQIEDYSNQFDIIFELIKVALNELKIQIIREKNIETNKEESEKDTIMKTYEGIFINENINGIMFNLLKEHPKYDVNNTNDLRKIYDVNTSDDNSGSKSNSLFKQHKLLKMDSINKTLLENYIKYQILDYGMAIAENKPGAISIPNDQRLFQFIKDLSQSSNSIYSLNYWSQEIFYLERVTGGIDTLSNRRPLIGNILERYLSPAPISSPLIHCSDFTFLIVLANYAGHQKCNEQVRLLMDMKDFIQTVTSE